MPYVLEKKVFLFVARDAFSVACSRSISVAMTTSLQFNFIHF